MTQITYSRARLHSTNLQPTLISRLFFPQVVGDRRFLPFPFPRVRLHARPQTSVLSLMLAGSGFAPASFRTDSTWFSVGSRTPALVRTLGPMLHSVLWLQM